MIELKNVSKTFRLKDGTRVNALQNVNLSIQDGEIYGIIGMSGAGKSTLIRTINFLEVPTEGQVLYHDTDLASLSEKELRKVRRDITMIFQDFNLMMQRNCLDNISFPLELSGVRKKQARARAKELLEIVGLPDKAKAYPAQLSGGQKQRIAIARALATDPKVLLCDEATSALDPKTTRQILDLIREINEKLNITVIIITHQMSVVEEVCEKVAILDEGNVVESGYVTDVFQRPTSDAGKRLVFSGLDNSEEVDRTQDLSEVLPDENTILLVFNGAAATNTPLIAQMAAKEGIYANILAAKTKSVGSKAYGNMLLSITSANNKTKQDAIAYLSQFPDLEVIDQVGGTTDV